MSSCYADEVLRLRAHALFRSRTTWRAFASGVTRVNPPVPGVAPPRDVLSMNKNMELSNHSVNTTSPPFYENIPIDVRSIPIGEVIYRSILGVLSVLVNATIIATVSSSRQLYYPRHLYWAGISTVYLMYVCQPFLEVVAIYWGNRVACQIYVLNATVPHTVISIYLLLAACDRLLAISCSEWYKKKMTNRRVIALLIVAYASTFSAKTAPFWMGHQRLGACTVNLTHTYRVMLVNLALAVICIGLHVRIFVVSRAMLRRYCANSHNTVVKFNSVSKNRTLSLNPHESESFIKNSFYIITQRVSNSR